MNKIRYLIMVVMCLIGHITTHAQDVFDPTSPTEPGAPILYSRVVLLRNINDAGSVSGEGRYIVGNTVNVYAYVNSEYSFVNWTDTKGNVLGTSTFLQFVNTEKTDTLIANYSFTPGNPNEPSDPSLTLYYRLGLKATQGCSVSGAGRYLAGTNVYVSAYVESGYDFLGWTDSKGETVSSNSSFYYTMPIGGDTLTANCVFNPDRPAEPGDPILKHNVTVTCSDGGYYYGETGRFLEGTTHSLSVNCNEGYRFEGWYLNGEFYTALSSFNYTIGKEDLNFYAKIVFDPASPMEPPMPALSMYSYYLMTVNGVPGETVEYPIFLANTEVVGDMNIRLTFPSRISVDPNDYQLSNLAEGYTVSITEAVDTISILDEGAKLYDFTLIGGKTQPGTQALLTFKAIIPDDMEPGDSWQVKINQISMVMEDGTAVTARTRNGRVGVYQWGDANTDGEVDVFDASLVITYVLGDEVELDEHIADIQTDGTLDIFDVSGIVSSVLDTSSKANIRKRKTSRTKQTKVL